MLKYYLDKTGKVIKSILFPSSEFVDTEPREGSLNPLASGAVANVMPQDATKDNPLMTAEDTERMIDAMKPIDAMTLRFEFSKKDYSPVVAGVGSAGTWTKVDSPTLNIWDWTNENTDWSNSFKGAFPDEDNEVSVIAAGDTSEVTTIDGMFAGVFTNNPSQTSYSVTTRNNLVSCITFDVSSCADFDYVFCCTKIKDVVRFRYNSLLVSISATFAFADTFIEYVDNLDFCSAKIDIRGIFARTDSLRKISIIGNEKVTNFTECFSTFVFGGNLEEVKIQEAFDNVTSFSLTFQNARKLKHSPKLKSNAVSVNCQGIYNQCFCIEDVDLEVNKANRVNNLFTRCYLLKTIPLIDTSTSTHFEGMMNNCRNVETIPDYDVSSAVTVQGMCQNMYNAKYGILEMYNKLLARGSAITNHTDCFKNCGRDTPQGRLALAQIPASWGGLAEG